MSETIIAIYEQGVLRPLQPLSLRERQTVRIQVLPGEPIEETEQEDYPTLTEVIAEIRTMQPNPANFHPATQSLAERLVNSPEDPSFDAEVWNREWVRVEAEMKAITHTNDQAEGRG
jgi:predicted DNA-binding antitoxin AbrB/MazE fold protein